MNYIDKINSYLQEEIEVIKNLDVNSINTVMNVMEEAKTLGKRIYVCGNGGSASTATHMVCDFNKGISFGQDIKYNLECLNDNIPLMMAVANDIGYDEIFRIPLTNKMEPGDVLIGISGSGNSKNVINAMQYAKEKGGTTIAFVGFDGGQLMQMADHCIHVKINNMQITEDVHIILNHLMMYVLTN